MTPQNYLKQLGIKKITTSGIYDSQIQNKLTTFSTALTTKISSLPQEQAATVAQKFLGASDSAEALSIAQKILDCGTDVGNISIQTTELINPILKNINANPAISLTLHIRNYETVMPILKEIVTAMKPALEHKVAD